METWHFVRGCPWHAELTFLEVGEWRFFSLRAKEWASEEISQRIYDLVLQSFTPLKSYFHPFVESIFDGAVGLGVGELRLNCSQSNSTSNLHSPSSKSKGRHTFFMYKDFPLAPHLAHNFSFLIEILNLGEGVTILSVYISYTKLQN